MAEFRHSFSKTLSSDLDLGGLTSVHKASYNTFLHSRDDSGPSLWGVIRNIFPINDVYGFASIDCIDYSLKESPFTPDECITKGLTYQADVNIKLRMVLFSVDEKTGTREIKAIKEQETFLCSIPLLTENGSFIINGIEKVVVSQIHKSPSVIFIKRNKTETLLLRVASVVPYRGSRLEFVVENNDLISCRIDKKKKISIYHLLNSFKISSPELISGVYSPVALKKEKDLFALDSKFFENPAVSFLTFNLRDKSGEILFSKGTVVTRLLSKKILQHEKLYLKVEDFEGLYLYSDTEITSGDIISGGSLINSKLISQIANLNEIVIINNCNKFFNPVLLNLIEENREVSYEESMIILAKNIYPSDQFVLEDAEKAVNNLFFNSSNYNLFQVGRYKINQKLSINSQSMTLTKEDIILILKNLVLADDSFFVEDIDNLSNRRIRAVGELVENQFRWAMDKVVKYAVEKLNSVILDTAIPNDFITNSPITKAIKEFFMLSELSQFKEQTNIVSELAHSRKVSSLGSGGVSRNMAKSEIRDIHQTHYGRICPIETPDGQNVGLITSLASYAKINRYGFIETPYRKIVNGKVSDEIIYLDASQEFDCFIAQVKDFQKDVTNKLIPARHRGEFVMVDSSNITHVDVSPKQIVSVVSSLIPFLECNDTGRALMGGNMQRQAVPLLFTSSPVVGTGTEGAVASNSRAVIRSTIDGIIHFVDSKIIVIKNSKDLSFETFSLKKFDRSNQSTCFNQRPIVSIGQKVKKGDVIADGPATDNGELALGKNVLVAFMPWNGYNYEDSIVVSKRLVNEDVFTSIHIEEFEVMVRDTRLGAEEITRDIPGISDGEVSYLDEAGIVHLGTNVRPGDILVGKTVPKAEAPITSEEKLLRAIFGDKANEKKDSSLRVPPGFFGTVVDVKILTKRGIIKDSRSLIIEAEKIKDRKRQQDIQFEVIRELYGTKVDLLLETSGKKIDKSLSLEKKLQSNVAEEIKTELQKIKIEFDLACKKSEDDYIKDVQKIMDGDDLPNGVLKIVKVYVALRSRIQPGDKIAGRHGNKGVVSAVVETEDMPFMEDGTPVDLILNSIGVIGRMNLGQILETHLGLASYGISKKLKEMYLQNNALEKVKSFLSEIATDKVFSKEISELKTEKDIIKLSSRFKDGMLFATPVFDGPTTDEISELLVKSGFDVSGQVTLYDGLTGQPFDKKVTVGYQYILKLHHLVDSKIHARSTGPYSLVTQQPLGGKSRSGGQRFGEMECWALEAYGAAYTLQEMLTVKSDDVTGRARMYESIIKGESGYVSSGLPESFNVLCKELKSLGFQVELGVDSTENKVFKEYDA